MKSDSVDIAIVGFGVVGSGVARILLNNRDSITEKTGLKINLTHIVDLDTTTPRSVAIPDGILHDNLDRVLNDTNVKIVAELIGGTSIAAEVQKKILLSGKHVVTANKALLAEKGEEIYAVARQSNCCVAFEASCCGGIPLISSIRTGLSGNRINDLYGIVNGTCNFILSSMLLEDKTYENALKEAQQKGYAEADPTLDVNGSDSAHKLAILSLLAFGKRIDYNAIAVTGINQVRLNDIHFGREMGYTMKLLAIAERNDGGLSLRVHPAFISNENYLAKVSGPYNAVSIYGDAVGHTSLFGQGAGMMPTASAVVADIIETAHGNSLRLFNAQPGLGRPTEHAVLCPAEDIISRFYLRMCVEDRPGVFARIAKVLGDNDISISSCLQHEETCCDYVPVIITTHKARQGNIHKALAEINIMDFCRDATICIPIVTPPAN